MNDDSLESIRRIAADIETNIYREPTMQLVNTEIQFKTQSDLINAMRLLKPLHFFSVRNMGRVHVIEFATLDKARAAYRTLEENRK